MTTDVIITIGPSSWSDETMSALLAEGIHAVRFPLSKETPQIHLENADRVRKLSKRAEPPPLLLADLPGGKPRLSNHLPIQVTAGAPMTLALLADSPEADLLLDPPLSELPPRTVGVTALVGDGEHSFHIESVVDGIATGSFMRSGVLERRLALTLPGVRYRISSFTDEDLARCAAVAHQFDWLALSFTQDAKDVTALRKTLEAEFAWRPRIMAKIETALGVDNVADIASVADAVMVARGDLALQVGLHQLWRAERAVLDACLAAGVYVVVATGLLDSLVHGVTPSRSEAVDVAAAAALGANALMLSAETTIGVDPVNAVRQLKLLAAAGEGPL